MAFRYRQITPVTGDIIDPEDWNANVREMVGEFNGHLDRDNLPEQAITTNMCKANTFHTINSDFKLTTKLQASTQDYVKVNRIEFQSQSDGVVICEWSAQWQFSDVKNSIETTDSNVVTVRILVNGNEICRLDQAPDSVKTDSGWIVGALDVPAGYLRIETEAKLERFIEVDTDSDGVKDTTTTQNATGDVTMKYSELVVVHKVR